jgi:hypothetical protein
MLIPPSGCSTDANGQWLMADGEWESHPSSTINHQPFPPFSVHAF